MIFQKSRYRKTQLMGQGPETLFFINENPNPKIIGDLEVYNSEEDLLQKLEPWYVDIGHIIFDANGECFKLAADDSLLSLQRLKSSITKDGIFECMHYLLSGCRPNHPLTELEFAEDCKDYIIEV